MALERRALDAFETALTWPPESRDQRLAAELGGEPILLEAVCALLRAEQAASLLPTQPPRPAERVEEAPPPERIGPYRLIGLIGRGGMGSVYMAERADGLFEQAVAIKLIRHGLFSRAAGEQFTLERKILARLRHPHIAQLFDGGVTQAGVSYIVMELIAGEPITTYAQSRAMPLGGRLALFLDACAAIQYAHQQLVAHADIKPSNIVVDERYGVKLLDFGISRLLEDAAEAEGDDAPSMAQTPAYASPQQARGERPTPLDDIYALGVLLKDLTTGCGGEDDDLKAVAAKASARAAEARYPAVGDLAADVRRWQAGYPVLARPAGRARLALKFWRRHRLPVSLSAAAVAGLIGAVAVTTTLYLQAEAARRQAEQRFAEVHAMSRFMLRDVTDSLERFPGAEQLRHDLADRARGYLEGLSRTPNASRDVRLEAAQGYAKTGEILARSSMQNLGDPVAGKAALTRAEVILRALDAERPGDPDVQLALAKTLLSRAAIASTDDNDKAGALTILGVACPMLDRVIAARPAMTAARLARWDCDLSRGNVLSDEARFAELVALMQATWAREKDVPAGDDPENLRPIYSGMTLNLLGDGLFYLDRKAEGLAWYLRSAQVLETARRTRPDIRVSDRLALTQYNIASGLSDMNRSAEALPWIDRAVEVVNEMRAFEDSPRARHVESIVRLQRAVNLGELHRYAEAIAEGEADVARRRAKAGENPHDYEGRRAYAVGLRPMGELYWSAGRRDQACATWRQTRAEWDRLAAGGGLMGFDRTAEVTFVDKLLRRCAPGA